MGFVTTAKSEVQVLDCDLQTYACYFERSSMSPKQRVARCSVATFTCDYLCLYARASVD